MSAPRLHPLMALLNGLLRAMEAGVDERDPERLSGLPKTRGASGPDPSDQAERMELQEERTP